MSHVISIPTVGTESRSLDEGGREVLERFGRYFEQHGVPNPSAKFPSHAQMRVWAGAVGGHRPPTLGESGALLVERDEHCVVVADPLGAAYGSGGSFAEAAAEWEELALDAYRELHAQRDRLHPRLMLQLRYLQRLFG